MKTRELTMLLLSFLMVGTVAVFGQTAEREVPGDDFSLEGALELFKKSGSPEEFEKLLNAQNSKVNNLDLNGDGYTDYLRVIDRTEGTVHAFTIQAIISDTESQDVAVISLDQPANGKAVLQITGDEDVYGIETIIEPTEEVRVNAGATTSRTVVNVYAWPAVQYVYSPYYTVWVSPWGWYSRPYWWNTWRPVAYYHYSGWWQPYRPYYARCYSHRVVYASRIYRPYRTTSVSVRSRHNTQLTHYRTTHRDDRGRGRYNDRPVTNRTNYRSDRTRTDVNRSNAPRERMRTSNGNERIQQQRPAQRQITTPRERQSRPTVDRERTMVQRHTTPERRSNSVERSNRITERSNPVMRQERSRPSDRSNSNRSQPRERSKRSR